MQAAYGSRVNARRLQDFGVMECWYLHAYPGRDNPLYQFDPKTRAVFAKALAKAEQTTSETLLLKTCHRDVDGAWRFFEEPPVLTRVNDDTAAIITASFTEYCESIAPERRFTRKCYRIVDVAHRIVGVGSVGTRAYLLLLFGSGDEDPLFLQVKEAAPAAHAPYVPLLPESLRHDGRRIVAAQRSLQSSIHVLLDWTAIDGRPSYVRQMRNMKASVPVEWLVGEPFNEYALVCGVILARAHARTSDAAKLPPTAASRRVSTGRSPISPKPTATRPNGTTMDWSRPSRPARSQPSKTSRHRGVASVNRTGGAKGGGLLGNRVPVRLCGAAQLRQRSLPALANGYRAYAARGGGNAGASGA